MAKKITIQIPEPCHEDWDKMSPQDLGRHCDSCEKVVVDFSAKSDAFIAKYFNEHNNICGRFRPSQLDRPINLATRRKSLLPPLAASFILPLAMLTANSAYGQEQTRNFKRTTEYVSLNIGSKQVNPYKDIKGVVKDTAGNPLPGVRIRVKQSNDQIQTDSSGTYRMRVREGHTLHFSYYLFLDEEIVVNQQQDLYDFVLLKDPNYLPEVLVVAQGIKREAKALGGAFSFIVEAEQDQKEKENTDQVQIPASIEEILKNKVAVCGLDTSYNPKLIQVVNTKTDSAEVESDNLIKIESVLMNQDNEVIPHVKIAIKGTAATLTTDLEGKFKTYLKPEDVLVFDIPRADTLELAAKTIGDTLVVEQKRPSFIMGGIIGSVSIVEYDGVIPWYHIGHNFSQNYSGNPEHNKRKKIYANTLKFLTLKKEKKKAERKDQRNSR